jgi:hypothetical protein
VARVSLAAFFSSLCLPCFKSVPSLPSSAARRRVFAVPRLPPRVCASPCAGLPAAWPALRPPARRRNPHPGASATTLLGGEDSPAALSSLFISVCRQLGLVSAARRRVTLADRGGIVPWQHYSSRDDPILALFVGCSGIPSSAAASARYRSYAGAQSFFLSRSSSSLRMAWLKFCLASSPSRSFQ